MTILISTIENAIMERLKKGLGKMVSAVESYGGEFDDAMPEVVRQLPAVWVTFGGVHASSATATNRDKWRTEGSFVVIVATRNVRSEKAGRHGGAHSSEVGSYELIYAVRRLLTRQDLGLAIDHLAPGKVKTLFNSRIENQAISAFALEFDTYWIEQALPIDRFPSPEIVHGTGGSGGEGGGSEGGESGGGSGSGEGEGSTGEGTEKPPVPANPDDPDNIFIEYEVELSPPDPEFKTVGVEIRQDATSEKPDLSAIVNFEDENHE